ALDVVAADGRQRVALGAAFDAFGDGLDAETVRQGDDRFGQRLVAAVAGQVVDERLVDLEVVDVEHLQVGQGGKAGAEIIDRDLGAGGVQGPEAVDDLLRVVDEDAFGDFHRDA